MSEQPTRPTVATTSAGEPGTGADRTRLDTVPDTDDGSAAPAPPVPDRFRPATADGGAADAGPLEAGTRIGDRYRLISPIAAGGMATVWRAVDEVLTRPVAVKVLHAHLAADPEFVARFWREAVAAARLAHPSIVAIYDTCQDPEAIVMELVDGRTLREELDRRAFLPPDEATTIASGIAQALEVAHKAGIVHRDVKPANVLLSTDGQLKVADFGIAKAARPDEDPDLPDLTATGHMVGTAKYLAPEQVSGGDVDARSDVYALGAVLYEMLCGRPPFTGANDLAIATARLHGQPERPRAVLRTTPPVLDEIVMRALASDPADRYPSAAAMWADLQAVEGHGDAAPVDTGIDPTTVTSGPSFARSERSWLVPAVLVVFVGVALGLAWLLIGGTDARRDLIDLVDRVAPGSRTANADEHAPLSAVASAFDPLGRDGEHDHEAAFAVDQDPHTGWTTERYETRHFGGLKSGVGLVLDVGESVDLAQLVIETPNADWSATIHVDDGHRPTLDEWGPPVAEIARAEAGATTIDIDDARGSYVLVWFTDLGNDPRVQLDVREIRLAAG